MEVVDPEVRRLLARRQERIADALQPLLQIGGKRFTQGGVSIAFGEILHLVRIGVVVEQHPTRPIGASGVCVLRGAQAAPLGGRSILAKRVCRVDRMEQLRLLRRAGIAVHVGGAVNTRKRVGRVPPAQAAQRGQQIDRADQRFTHASRAQTRGPAHQQRHEQRFLVGHALQQAAVRVHHVAVIGSKHHDRVVRRADGIELVEHDAEHFVQRGDLRPVVTGGGIHRPVRILPLARRILHVRSQFERFGIWIHLTVAIRHLLVRIVRRAERNRQAERPIIIVASIKELARQARLHFGFVPLFANQFRRVAEIARVKVIVRAVVHRPVVVEPQPPRPGRDEHIARRVHVPLAHVARAVAVVARDRAHRRQVGAHDMVVEHHAMRVRVRPGEHRRTVRAADRRRREMLRASHALARHPIERRRHHLRVAGTVHVLPTHLVGKDEQQVR